MSDTVLFVPMKLEAWVVNARGRALPVRRWATDYFQLANFASPVPAPFQGDIEANFNDPKNEGVYLHWTLPAALRHGVQARGQLDVPLVPNRWLVVRMSGDAAARKAKAWIIESDCPSTDSGSSTAYWVDPEILAAWKASRDPRRQRIDDTVRVQLIGASSPLAGWTEQGIDTLFLKAVAPGNPSFTAYQPNVRNILSFHDRLSEDGIVKDTLSYLVVGWYSNPQADPLRRWQDAPASTPPDKAYVALLDELGWLVSDTDPPARATKSLVHAMAHGVEWDRDGALPPNAPQTLTNLHVAIGDTTVGAFKALVDRQLQDRAQTDPTIAELLKRNPGVAGLLEAFQYDLLASLDEPGGEALLQQRIHAAAFGSDPGGYRWTITDAEPPAGADLKKLRPKSAAQRAAETLQEGWLDALNASQAAYDEAQQELQAARWQLYAAWWKKGRFDTFPPFARPSGVTAQELAEALDRWEKKVSGLTAKAEALRPLLPQPLAAPSVNPADAFQNGIRDFADKKRKAGQLAEGRVLKALSAPRFWQAHDPVILISGTRAPQRLESKEKLPCRLAGQLVDSLKVKGKTLPVAQLAGALPSLDTGKLVPGIQGVFSEFLFLDPGSAPSLARLLGNIDAAALAALIEAHAQENFGGVLPARLPARWTQPWSPLFVEWKVDWYPIDHLSPKGKPCWSFDGTGYRYTGALDKDTVTPWEVAGRTFLTPQTAFTFKSRLNTFLTRHPEAQELNELNKLVGQVDDWDFFSQTLEGFDDTLARLDRRATATPSDPKWVGLMGDQARTVPLLPPSPPSSFPGIRQGQFAVQQLILYDAFGQVLEVVGKSGLKRAEIFRPVLAEGLLPDHPIVSRDPERFVQLPPALLQHARLDFRLVDSVEPKKPVDLHGDANPIGGWLVPNHVDWGILLYDRDGVALGELRLTENAKGQRSLTWQPPPDRPGETLERAPMVLGLVNGLKAKGAAVFDDFLTAIDTSLWTIDPGASRDAEGLGPMVGRPLALVRAGLRFALDAPPLQDSGWKAASAPKPPDFVSHDFDVRLGDQALRKDGLVGYFLDGNYDTFHCVPAAAPANGYLEPVAPGHYVRLSFDGTREAGLVMLVDPMASIHAFTGLLPVKELSLPSRCVQPALRRMEVTFLAGPLLAETRPAGGEGGTQPALAVPVPPEKHAEWSWLQPRLGALPSHFPLAPADDRARLSEEPPELREGFLRLTPARSPPNETTE